ncbi:MAG: hypothetical protein BWY28_02590 [bacterium ADurb.Bin236]|nr:MAG: hypothetical protein BWY28_02590 [bacterium ADurb.Bin236]
MSVVTNRQYTPLFTLDYQYDYKGNITEIESAYDWLPGEVITQEFTYDSTDQLVTATGNTENDSIYSNAIEYGNWGKIQQYDIEITDPLTSNQTINHTDYTYPTSYINRTQTLFGVDSSSSNALNFTYDFGINGSLRRKESEGNSEYYLFNAFNNMKAYSYNGERFGYYGYDASGERTYKIDFDATFSKENGVISVQSLDVEKMTLYPNGYVNINQNGEYTKHYYADALRIASKIGSGFTGNICDSATTIDFFDYLNARITFVSEIMEDELNEVVVPTQNIQQINPMPYPTFCNLGPGGQETNLFFYHPDHLGSTGMVTDNNANVTQGLFYAPFGEIISDYNPSFHDTLMPNFAFNAKELDEENGMYYYSARYYAPPTFISRDPMFEKYPSISPYTYCANNPMKFVDPTGKDIYQVVTRADAAREQSRTAATKDICGRRAARPASAGINSIKIMPRIRASP